MTGFVKLAPDRHATSLRGKCRATLPRRAGLDTLPYVKDAVQNPQYKLSLFASAVVKQANGFYVDLFNDAEYRAIVGRSFNFATDTVLAMNGDYSANANTIDGVIFRKNENIISCHINDQTTALMRINYVIAARR